LVFSNVWTNGTNDLGEVSDALVCLSLPDRRLVAANSRMDQLHEVNGACFFLSPPNLQFVPAFPNTAFAFASLGQMLLNGASTYTVRKRVCGTASGSRQIDTMGCDWNMPGNYGPGFDSCQGDR
jgi:hypothetical protein